MLRRYKDLRCILVTFVIVCFLVIISIGCSDNESKTEKLDQDKPIDINIDIKSTENNKDIVIIKNKDNDMDMYGGQLKAWEEYIFDKYELIIDIVNINGEHGNFNVDELKKKADLNGFIYVRNSSELAGLIEADLIKPVNHYLKDIPQYATANDLVFGAATDRNENIWMFPIQFGGTAQLARYYNYEWLIDANIDVPETIDEFYEYAKFLREYEVIGEENKEIYIAEFSVGTVLIDFPDVFKAFGCYPDGEYWTGCIGYNPIKEEFEVSILNEGFIEAISFIKMLYDEKLIIDYPGLTDKDWVDRDYFIGSSTDRRAQSIIDEYYKGWDIGLYLTGANEGNLISMRTADYGLAVQKNTTNIVGKLNNLLSAVNKGDEAMMDFFYGVKDVQYEYTDGRYKFIGDSWIDLQFALGDFNKAWFEMPDEDDDWNDGLNKKDLTFDDLQELRQVEEAKYYGSELNINMPFDPQFATIGELNMSLIQDVKELMRRIFYYDIDIEDAIYAFRQQLQVRNVFEKIDELNKNH